MDAPLTAKDFSLPKLLLLEPIFAGKDCQTFHIGDNNDIDDYSIDSSGETTAECLEEQVTTATTGNT